MRLLLFFLLFPFSAMAQMFDLGTMPPGWSFVSNEKTSTVTVTYAGQSGAAYLFDIYVENLDGTIQNITINVNSGSQTLLRTEGIRRDKFLPNDCVPTVGVCNYSWVEGDQITEMRVITRMQGDIWITEEYSKSGGEWLFYYKSCSLYDEYGFWYDYVRTYWDGATDYGARERAGETRLDALWTVCAPEQLTS